MTYTAIFNSEGFMVSFREDDSEKLKTDLIKDTPAKPPYTKFDGLFVTNKEPRLAVLILRGSFVDSEGRTFKIAYR